MCTASAVFEQWQPNIDEMKLSLSGKCRPETCSERGFPQDVCESGVSSSGKGGLVAKIYSSDHDVQNEDGRSVPERKGSVIFFFLTFL